MFPVEEFYLEHILSMTDYKTKAMEKLEKSGLTNRSATTIEDLANKLSNTVSVSGDIKEDEDDVVIEEEPGHHSSSSIRIRIVITVISTLHLGQLSA